MRDIPLHYEVAGDGAPVVLIHGALMTHRMWDEQWAILPRSYRTVRYDLPGHGRSAMPDVVNERDDVARLLDGLEIESAHFVSLSLGSRIAIDFALERPNRVRSLVVTMGGVEGYEGGFPVDVDAGFERAIAAAKGGDFSTAASELLDLSPMRPAAAIPSVRARLAEMIGEFSWAPFTREIRFEPLLPPAGHRIGELRCPVLVVGGDLDIEAFREQARWLARSVPSARRVEITGAGHMPNMERPAEYNRALLEFLAEVEANRGRRDADALSLAS